MKHSVRWHKTPMVDSKVLDESVPTTCTRMLWPLCCRGCKSRYNYSTCASNNLATWHFYLCSLAHFLHLLASRNSSPVIAMFNRIQHPMRLVLHNARFVIMLILLVSQNGHYDKITVYKYKLENNKQ